MSQSQRLWSLVALVAVALAVIVLAILAIIRARTGETPPGPTAGPPALSVDAGNLFDAYLDNAVAAEARYGGKPIEVKGWVCSVGPDSLSFSLGSYSGVSPFPRIPGSRMPERPLSETEKRWAAEGRLPPSIICRFPRSQAQGFARARSQESFSVVGIVVGMKDDPEAWKGRVLYLDRCRPAK